MLLTIAIISDVIAVLVIIFAIITILETRKKYSVVEKTCHNCASRFNATFKSPCRKCENTNKWRRDRWKS